MINEQIIQQYAIKHSLSLSESLRLHGELELFFDSVVKNKIPLSPTKEIDNVWHDFILHTKHYAKYCAERYGFFIHHNPHIVTNSVHQDRDCNTECDSAVYNINNNISDCSGCSSCDSQVIISKPMKYGN